jgi:ribosome-binding ATPase YchF (GTP1/OBG family)
MSYIHHKALDDLHKELSERIDMFVESYLGRFKKQPVRLMQVSMQCNTDAEGVVEYLQAQNDQLKNMLKSFEAAPQIQSIIEEMMALMDKCVYVCNLHDCRCKM